MATIRGNFSAIARTVTAASKAHALARGSDYLGILGQCVGMADELQSTTTALQRITDSADIQSLANLNLNLLLLSMAPPNYSRGGISGGPISGAPISA